MMIKKKKGFTLVEVLAVIVILGILSTIGIVTVVNTRKSQEEKFDQTQRELFMQTAKIYFSDNKTKLPIISGDTSKVYLQDLIDDNYLDSLLDYNKNNYELDSYVEILKIGGGLYYYDVKLIKKGNTEYIPDNSKDTDEERIIFNYYKKGTITMTLVNGKYYSNKNVNIGISIKDSDVIMAYCYSIYRNGIKIYTSEFIVGNNKTEMSDVLTLDLAERSDGKYKIELVVYDMKNHVKKKESDQIVIDRVPPECESSGGNTSWTNVNVTIKGTCLDNKGGSGCKQNITKTYTTNTNSTTETPGTVYDIAGNSRTCPADRTIKIDKTPPSCYNSGGSTSWTNSNVILVGNCYDTGGSGCKQNATKIFTTNIYSTTETPGTVYDNAGNSTLCRADQTVKIDKTPPSCYNSGGSTSWTNSNVTIKGTCYDTGGSGCIQNITKTYTTNTNSTTETPGTVYDNAGNSKTCPSDQTVKIDKTPPSCYNSGGSTSWTNSSVTITGTCYDTGGSGCRQNITKTYTSNTNSTTETPGTVYDNAGNSKTCLADRTIKIDKTPPSCYSSGGSTSWTNSNVKIKGTCSDTGGSGCKQNVTKTYTTNIYSTTETPGTVYDNAGNSKTCPSQTVKIDKTPPTCGTWSGDSTSWTNSNRTISMTCSDTGGSGCSSSTYSKKFTNDTKTASITFYISDDAGNTKTCTKTKNIYIDKTAPTISLSVINSSISTNCPDPSGSSSTCMIQYSAGHGVQLKAKDTGGSGLDEYGAKADWQNGGICPSSWTWGWNRGIPVCSKIGSGAAKRWYVVRDRAGNNSSSVSSCQRNGTVYNGTSGCW